MASMVKSAPNGAKPKKHPKAKPGLKRVSSELAKELRKYWPLRKKFLEEHPLCQFPGCTLSSVEVHHIALRGKNLLKVETWLATCSFHGGWVHSHANQAREMGLLK